MHVLNRISEYRKKNGISQSYLASLVGVSRNSISLFENQKMNPSLDVAVFLMRIFQCSFEDLFYIDFEWEFFLDLEEDF